MNEDKDADLSYLVSINKIPEAERGAVIERHQRHSIEHMRWKNASGIVGMICLTAFLCTCMVMNCG